MVLASCILCGEVKSEMMPNKTSRPRWWVVIGTGVQLALSFAISAVVAIEIARSGHVVLALVAATGTGLVLTFTLQRTIWLVDAALRALNAGQLPDRLPARWHGPLRSLIVQIDALIARVREVHDLRQNLLRQASDAAAQQERNRLARELHDSIKQQIFGISMAAAAVEARWNVDPQGAREALGDVRRSTQEAMVEMNALLQQLAPAPLEKVGLRQALRDQCEALGYRTGAEVRAEFGELPGDDRLPPGAQESLFRIAQEALSNVARHARADQVRLYLGLPDRDDALILEIQDNGQGFEGEAEYDGSEPHRGMGLDNIRQRVSALDGDLDINSAPGEGMVLRVSIPLVGPETLEEEEATAYRQDHTFNKAFLVGLGGGLALIAVLFYPLYVLLPDEMLAGWPVGSRSIGFILQIVAALLPVATGFLAAYWAGVGSRQEGALLGALAGGVAGTVLYFGLGAAAAAVMGNAPLLEHGLLSSAEGELVRLVSEAATGVAWWSYGAFWAALLAGTGLGAVGGLAVPSGSQAVGGMVLPAARQAPEQVALRLTASTILTAAALASILALSATLVIFPVLEPRIRDILTQYGMSPATTLPLEGVSLWPVGTALILYTASLGLLCFLLRVEIRTQDAARLGAARAKAGLFGLLCFGIPGWLLLVGQDSVHYTPVLRAVAVITVLCSLVLGALCAATLVEAQRRSRALPRTSQHPVRGLATAGALLSVAVIVWALALPSTLSMLVALIIIPADLGLIFILRRQSTVPLSDGASPARLQLAMVQSINAGLGAAVVMLIPMMALLGAAFGVVTITIPSISMLVNHNAAGQPSTSDPILVEAVRSAYATQARVFLFAFVIAAAIIGLWILANSGRMAIARRANPDLPSLQ